MTHDGVAVGPYEQVSEKKFRASNETVMMTDEFPITVYGNGFGKPQSDESVPGTQLIIIVVVPESTDTTDATRGCGSASGMKRETVGPAGAEVTDALEESCACTRERIGRRLRSDLDIMLREDYTA
jgi:hypothetical protein